MRVFENRLIHDQWTNKVPDDVKNAQLVVFFASTEISKNQQCYQQLRECYPSATILGCSTGGEICQDDVHDDTLASTAMCFDSTKVKLAKINISACKDSRDAGQKLGQELNSPDLKCLIVISDGLQVNGSELVQGLTHIIGKQVPITGGLAGDGDRFQETYVCANCPPEKGLIGVVGLYGDKISVSHGSAGGWDAFGPERRITKSKANVLYELDGKPALELYKTYLGEEAAKLPGSALLFPLTIRPAADKNYTVIRTILSVNEDDQSMTFAGDVPEGYVAQLMRGNMDHLVDGAAEAARTAKPENIRGDHVSILISCIGRKLLMGQRVSDEINAVRSIMGNQTKMIGFYSYGEISPHANSGMCELHNQTMTITTLAESA